MKIIRVEDLSIGMLVCDTLLIIEMLWNDEEFQYELTLMDTCGKTFIRDLCGYIKLSDLKLILGID